MPICKTARGESVLHHYICRCLLRRIESRISSALNGKIWCNSNNNNKCFVYCRRRFMCRGVLDIKNIDFDQMNNKSIWQQQRVQMLFECERREKTTIWFGTRERMNSPFEINLAKEYTIFYVAKTIAQKNLNVWEKHRNNYYVFTWRKEIQCTLLM